MALTPISGEIITQSLNDNFSYLNERKNDLAINVKDYGAKGDGVTDDTTAIQSAANEALASNRVLYFPTGKYLITSPIKVSNDNVTAWPMLEIVGADSGSAVSMFQSDNAGTTIITDGNSAFEFEFFNFYNESVKVRHLSFRNKGIKAGTTAISYQFNQSSYARKQLVQDCNFYNFGTAIEFEGMSATFNNNYFGTTVIDFCHTYQCDTPIHFNNAFANLFECKNSLLHGATTGGILFSGTDGGGVISLSNTHLEGCEPAGIIPGTKLLYISLRDCSSESTGVASDKGLFDLDSVVTTTRIRISGNFSTNLMPFFTLGKNAELSVTQSFVTIRSKGGIVLTPETVVIDADDGGYSFALFPIEKTGKPYRSEALNRFSGTTTGRNPSYNANVPKSLLTEYSFVSSSIPYSHATSFGTSASARYLVASFIVQVTSSVGFDTASQFIIDGVTTKILDTYVQDNKTYPLVVVLLIPIAANADLTNLVLSFRQTLWATPAYVSFEDTTRRMLLSSLGHPQNEQMEEVVSLSATGGAYTFKEFGLYQGAYAIEAHLILNDGKDGYIKYQFYGIAQNTLKYRDVTGASKNASITVVEADGDHTDLYNVTVTNNTASAINVSLRIIYRS